MCAECSSSAATIKPSAKHRSNSHYIFLRSEYDAPFVNWLELPTELCSVEPCFQFSLHGISASTPHWQNMVLDKKESWRNTCPATQHLVSGFHIFQISQLLDKKHDLGTAHVSFLKVSDFINNLSYQMHPFVWLLGWSVFHKLSCMTLGEIPVC